jgi:hypothetical protein
MLYFQVQGGRIPFGCSVMALFDIISTHEITVNIIQYLITIYIAMIVGAGTAFGW